jgi:hypothetical protein
MFSPNITGAVFSVVSSGGGPASGGSTMPPMPPLPPLPAVGVVPPTPPLPPIADVPAAPVPAVAIEPPTGGTTAGVPAIGAGAPPTVCGGAPEFASRGGSVEQADKVNSAEEPSSLPMIATLRVMRRTCPWT